MAFKKGHKINVGRKVSEETRMKLSIVNKGKKLTEEHKKKISENTATKRPEVREKMRLSHIGKTLSEEQIKKIVESRKWYKHSEKTKQKLREAKLGSKNPMFGQKLSKKVRLKLSESAKKFWNSEEQVKTRNNIEKLRKSVEYKLWREAVYERDNYTCVWCGDNKGGNLNADHIKPFALYPELRFAIDNGRTLCEPCHKTTDTWGHKTRELKKKLCQK